MSRLVMAVTFTRHGTLRYLEVGSDSYVRGDAVLYPTSVGPAVAWVVWPPQEVHDLDGPLPRCAGPATSRDLERARALRDRKAWARGIAQSRIAAHGLPMRVVAIDVVEPTATVDDQVTVYYTAPGRVDFRALVPDLARALGARVLLSQVHARDAAKLIGGVGHCGRTLCCSTFQPEFPAVDAEMMRDQQVGSNPLRIAGACGRLMCCLSFEQPWYEEFDRLAPALGELVDSTDGQVSGVVVERSAATDSVTVVDGESGARVRCPRADVCVRRARVDPTAKTPRGRIPLPRPPLRRRPPEVPEPGEQEKP